MTWTPDKIATVRLHWGDKTAREIGLMIGKTKNAVVGKAARLGLKRMAVSPQMREQAIWDSQDAVDRRIMAMRSRYEAA